MNTLVWRRVAGGVSTTEKGSGLDPSVTDWVVIPAGTEGAGTVEAHLLQLLARFSPSETGAAKSSDHRRSIAPIFGQVHYALNSAHPDQQAYVLFTALSSLKTILEGIPELSGEYTGEDLAALDKDIQQIQRLIRLRMYCHNVNNILLSLGFHADRAEIDTEAFCNSVSKLCGEVFKISLTRMPLNSFYDFSEIACVAALNAALTNSRGIWAACQAKREAGESSAEHQMIEENLGRLRDYATAVVGLHSNQDRFTDIIDFLKALASRRPKINLVGPRGLSSALIGLDPDVVSAVFDVIWDNAVRYSGKTDDLILTIKIELYGDDLGKLRIDIADNGRGFDWNALRGNIQSQQVAARGRSPTDAELREYWLLRHPETTTRPKNANGGQRNSMGLAMVDCLVQRIGGGAVKILPNLRRGGAHIQIELPLVPGPPAAAGG